MDYLPQEVVEVARVLREHYLKAAGERKRMTLALTLTCVYPA